jgi:hypothetical protein
MITRPRPVMTAAGVSGLITSAAGVLTFLGYNDASAKLSAMATSITSVVIFVVVMGSHLLGGLHAQGKVTPMVAPQDHDGTPLVRIDAVSSLAPAPDPVPMPVPEVVGPMQEVNAAPEAASPAPAPAP